MADNGATFKDLKVTREHKYSFQYKGLVTNYGERGYKMGEKRNEVYTYKKGRLRKFKPC